MATHRSDLLYWIDDASYEEGSEIAIGAEREAVVIPEKAFIRMLRLERLRTERSGRAFMLVLIKNTDCNLDTEGKLLSQVAEVLARVTRETDLLGWYESGSMLGLLMLEITEANAATHSVITQKILMAIEQELTAHEFRALSFQFRLFPQDLVKSSNDDDGSSDNDVYYPDISRSSRTSSGGYSRILKRSLDIVGSLFALLVFSPFFVVIAVIVKLTSRGPILFCQKRVGHYGKEFNFYKFRTMYSGNDPRIHQEYVSKLIAGDLKSDDGFKMTDDPRVTPIGKFLRRSSLDELPQFFNVLKNDMSLVGPRPPLPYEFARYKGWHKRRVLEVKPGLTGLWQVEGRSRTTFDEMVRMDIRYGVQQSLWFDLKILLRTPSAMFTGRGAC